MIIKVKIFYTIEKSQYSEFGHIIDKCYNNKILKKAIMQIIR